VSDPRFYLASASPRRLELLRGIGIEPIVVPSAIEEGALPGEGADELVQRLAEAKGRDVARRLPPALPGILIAADTEVVLDGVCLGKPKDARQARVMLRRLRGRVHDVLTGVFLMRTDDGRSVCDLERSRVHFHDFDEPTLEAYVATGESADKAGAYGLQGRGAELVQRIEGSWSNVVGLPIERLPTWLKSLAVDRPAPAGERRRLPGS